MFFRQKSMENRCLFPSNKQARKEKEEKKFHILSARIHLTHIFSLKITGNLRKQNFERFERNRSLEKSKVKFFGSSGPILWSCPNTYIPGVTISS